MALTYWSQAPDGTTADNLGLYQYLEYKDSGKESYAPGSSNVTRCFIVPWEDRTTFLDDLLGYSYLDANLKINRVLPDTHPQLPAFYATDASVQGKGILSHTDKGAINWTAAWIECNYKFANFDIVDDLSIGSGTGAEMKRYTTRTSTFHSDYMNIQGNMKFVSQPYVGTPGMPRALKAQPGKVTTQNTLQYTWHEVPGRASNPYVVPTIDTIMFCMGTVNSVPFDVTGINADGQRPGAPPGTVLFVGVEPKLITPKLSDGIWYWDIVYSFLYRNNGIWGNGALAPPGYGDGKSICGHNYIFDVTQPGVSAGGRWDLITATGLIDGNPMYLASDLNELWSLSPFIGQI